MLLYVHTYGCRCHVPYVYPCIITRYDNRRIARFSKDYANQHRPPAIANRIDWVGTRHLSVHPWSLLRWNFLKFCRYEKKHVCAYFSLGKITESFQCKFRYQFYSKFQFLCSFAVVLSFERLQFCRGTVCNFLYFSNLLSSNKKVRQLS